MFSEEKLQPRPGFRPLSGLALLVTLLIPAARPQSTDNAAQFAVAAIRPNRPETIYAGGAIDVNGRRFTASNASLKDLLVYAYMLHGDQLSGGPAWLSTDRFDVVAEAESTQALTQPVARKMVQRLLADRFGFQFHPDRKELSIYRIVPEQGGPRLTKSAGDPNGFRTFGFPMLGQMVMKNSTIAEFANFLQRYVLDRPVLDDSAIAGRYDFQLDWTADSSQFAGRANQLPAPSRGVEPPDLFTAFREQLGLRLTR
jgi:uncharacterized protein (TIGR03435 family)